MRKMLETEIAWCAGLFEGEGSIFLVKQIRKDRKDKPYNYIRLAIKMTDLDVIQQFSNWTGCGTIITQSDKNFEKQPKKWKRHYYLQITNAEQIKILMYLFWHYLGKRRKDKIIELGILDGLV